MRHFSARQGSYCGPLILLLAAFLLLAPRTTPAANEAVVSFAPALDIQLVGTAGVGDPEDLDGDGHLDVIGACGPGVVTLYGHGDGTFDDPIYVDAPGDPVTGDVVAADVNRDGLKDLIISRPRVDTVEVLLNLGNRTFSAATVYTVHTSPLGVHVRDLNKDGWPDLAIAGDASNNLLVMLNDGTGAFPSINAYRGSSAPSRVTSGDWDNDGDIDLAMANYSSDLALLYFNDGTGHFVQSGSYNIGDMPAQIVSADFNRDGNADLAGAGVFGGVVSVYFGNGTGGFTMLAFYGNIDGAHIMKVADMDGDQYPDLVIPNRSRNYFTILHNKAGADFEKLPAYTSTGTDLSVLGVGDFDEDGRPDVVTGHGGNPWVSIFLNRTGEVPPAAPNLTSVSPVAYNRVDLAWQDLSLYESGFRIERAPVDGSFLEVGRVAKNATTFSDTTTVGSHTYRYRVVAYNLTGENASNEVQVTTPQGPPAAPSGLAVSENPPGAVLVTWVDNSSDEDGFTLERLLQGQTSPTTFQVGANKTSFTDNSTSPNKRYLYRVRAVRGSLASDPAQFFYTTVPSPPGSLAATAKSTTSIDVSWTNSNGSTVVSSIERSADGGVTWTECFTGPPVTLLFSDTGLLTDHEYRYRGRFLNSTGYSASTGVVIASTLPTKPAAASGLSVQPVSSSQLKLTWVDNSSNEANFRIQRKNQGNWVEVGQAAANTTQYTDTSLAANTTQTYRVLAANAGGLADPSNEASGLTIPAMPTGFVVAPLAQRRLDLSWNDPNPGGAATKVDRSTDGGATFSPVTTVAAGTHTYQDANLDPDRSYSYRLTATNASGDSPPTSAASGTTWPLPPAPVTNLHVSLKTQTTLRIAWDDPQSSETGFRIERKNGNQWNVAGSVSANTTSFELGGLQPETVVTLRVFSVNIGGDAASAPEITDSTLPLPLGAPQGFAAAALSDSQIKLSWTDSSGETSYRIERKRPQDPGFTPVASPGPGSAEFTDTGLTELALCTYRLYAVNPGGDSPAAEAGTTTLPKAPDPVTGQLRVRQILVSWSDNSAGESGYRIEAKIGNAAFHSIGQAPANSSNYVHDGLTPNVTYTYRVVALGPGGQPVSQPAVSAPITVPPNAATAKLSISPKTLNFGAVKANVRKVKTVTLKNAGKETMTVFVGDPASPFRAASGQGVFNLAPKATRKVAVELFADSKGAKSASLPISTTATPTPSTAVALKASVK